MSILKEIVFIDSNVNDLQSIILGINPNIYVVKLNDKIDVITQIANILDNYHELNAIHIFSHGSTGNLFFSNGSLNNENISNYASDLKRIGSALSESGDLLLYGCNVAKGDDGLAFINTLADLTGADVAASKNLTGYAALGGDWVLEKNIGNLDVQVLSVYQFSSILSNTIQVINGPYSNWNTGIGSIYADTLAFSGTVNGVTGNLYTLAGNDVVTFSYYSSSASVHLGSGNDQVTLTNNTSYANWGANAYGDAGNDSIAGGVGDDRLHGGDGSDSVNGGAGNDEIYGGGGTDTLIGGAGNDFIWGDCDSNSSLYFCWDDQVYQEQVGAADSIDGGDGNDVIIGDEGLDTLTGGAGQDEFVYEAVDEFGDIITDFQTGATGDSIFLNNLLTDSVLATTPLSSDLVRLVQSGTNTLVQIDLDGALGGYAFQTVATLQNVTASNVLSSQIVGAATAYELKANSIPTGSVKITGTATQNQVLTASNTLADADGLGSISYQWLSNGSVIANANQVTYTLTQTDVGKAISVKASYTDLLGTAESVISSQTNLIATKTNSLPIGSVNILGTAIQNQTLTVSNTIADSDGLGSISYSWLRDGVIISNTNQSAYTLTQADVGKSISVKASYTDLLGTAESVTSSQTNTVASKANSLPTGSVNISGTATQNQILTASNNLADADGLGSINYQWLSSGNLIPNASQQIYTLKQSDVGKAISVKVSYVDKLGTTESVTSSQTNLVANVNDLPTGSIIISGSVTQSQILTASNSLVDADGLGAISYQWLSNGSVIANANQVTYTLTQTDVGKAISVKASYTDLLGTAESIISSQTNPVVSKLSFNSLPTGTVTITGIAIQNQILTANNTLADVDGLGFITYTWKRDGVLIPAADKSIYILTKEDVGKNISVKANYIDLLGTAESVSSNEPYYIYPLPTGNLIIFGTPTQKQTLTYSAQISDQDGVGVLGSQWLRNGIEIAGATNGYYSLTQADVSKSINIKVSYTDKLGVAKSFQGVPTIPVNNDNDLPTGKVIVLTENVLSSTAKLNQTLTINNTLADADGLGVISYTWLRDDEVIGNETSSTYTLNQADAGKSISVKASYTDLFGTNEGVTSNQVFVNSKVNSIPTGSVVITGKAIQNQVLTASNDLFDADGLGSIGYLWLRDGVAISSATQSIYTLTQSDVGKSISVKASYIDQLGTSENVTSSQTNLVALKINILPTGNVNILGIAIQNQVLTVSNTLADADGLGSISYQWLSNGNVIANANQVTYTLTQSDVGKVISVKASYVDQLGTAESLISSLTSPVASVNYTPVGNVSITGTTVKGALLTASNNLVDANGLGTITYQWLSNGVAIPNANQSSYQLTQADTGQNISVKASYTDLQNTAESLTSSNLPINKNNAPTGSVTIKGLATWGTTLSVTSTIKDADGIGKLSYSWQSDNGELSTSPTYTLAESDVDSKVWVTLSYTDKKGSLEEEDSKPVDVTISTKPSAANDILTGTDKADKLSGLAGNDTLIGGAGSDKLTGGKGIDTFSFSSSDFYTVNSTGDLVFNKSVDTITDFNLKEHDVIDLGDLGQLTFFSSLNAAQEDMASLFYVKGAGKIYLNTNQTDGFTPSVIIIISGKPAVNADMTDFNYTV